MKLFIILAIVVFDMDNDMWDVWGDRTADTEDEAKAIAEHFFREDMVDHCAIYSVDMDRETYHHLTHDVQATAADIAFLQGTRVRTVLRSI